MAFLRVGATIVVVDHFDAERALAAIERYEVTHSQWVPTMFIRMLRLPDEVRVRHDISSLRYAVHAAAPCPVPVKEQMIAWWGPVLHEYYAGTEGNGFVYCDSATWLAHPGTVGRSILGVLHICDENGEELPTGQEGIIYFESETQFEYHGDPVKTEQSRDPAGHGWTTLGDIGYLDSEGFLYLTDRRSYMIISGGVNPAAAGPELEKELIDYCRTHMAHYKCPRNVDFVPGLPRHPTGKLLKRLLRDRYWPASGSQVT
jgi:acyl-CoA synthetase (AMP-forming)/AMP-acid ligase II